MATSKIEKPDKYSTVKLNTTQLDVIIKTGTVSCSDGADVTVTFPAEFPTMCWAVIATCGQGGFNSASTVSVKSKTKGGCVLHQKNTASAAMTIQWVAIGY